MSTLSQLVEPVKSGTKPKAKEPDTPGRIAYDNDKYVDVIPYNAYFDDNCRNWLFWLYDKLREDDLLRLYYPNVNGTDRSYPMFVRMMSSDVTQVLLVVLKDKQTDEVASLVGLATWERMSLGPSTVGHAGFIFLRQYWDHHTSMAAGQRILKYWFEEMPQKLDIAVGIIAKLNVLANRFVKRLGWTLVGELPNCQQYGGEPCDAVMWQITRSAYEGTS
jgi:RimJ/RimL family protein N-acetyltransferase